MSKAEKPFLSESIKLKTPFGSCLPYKIYEKRLLCPWLRIMILWLNHQTEKFRDRNCKRKHLTSTLFLILIHFNRNLGRFTLFFY